MRTSNAHGAGRMTTASTLGRVGVLAFTLIACLALWSARAQAYEGIDQFVMAPSGTQAGGHPDVHIDMEWDDSEHKEGQLAPPATPCVCDDARILTQQFPTGFIGNPTATPPCQLVEFSVGRCPASTQVGTFEVGIFNGFGPLYNLTPHPDEPALTGFWVPLISAPQFISLSGRTESDYGLNAESSPIYHPLSNHILHIELWGVPADESHYDRRFHPPLVGFGLCNEFTCPNGGAIANVPPIADRAATRQHPVLGRRLAEDVDPELLAEAQALAGVEAGVVKDGRRAAEPGRDERVARRLRPAGGRGAPGDLPVPRAEPLFGLEPLPAEI